MIDHTMDPVRGYYMRAGFPEEDICDLKTFLRADKLKRQGVSALRPLDLLQYLPVVEPVAMGTAFEECTPGVEHWEGHRQLKEGLSWAKFPGSTGATSMPVRRSESVTRIGRPTARPPGSVSRGRSSTRR